MTALSAEPDPLQLRELAGELAGRAAALLRRRPDELDADTKSSQTDPVTVMDRAAERVVVEGLRRARPADAILSEEGGGGAGTSGVRWVVDPLDGTVNYLYDIPAYAVSIAAEVDGTVVAGVVHHVTAGIRYDAVRRGGARADGKPLRIRDCDSLPLAMVGTGFSYDASVRGVQGGVVARLLPLCRDIRRFGAAALDLCSVAAGQLDAFYEVGLKPWDRAAGLLVAAEAGARTGELETPIGVATVAAAPAIFDEFVATLAELHR